MFEQFLREKKGAEYRLYYVYPHDDMELRAKVRKHLEDQGFRILYAMTRKLKNRKDPVYRIEAIWVHKK